MGKVSNKAKAKGKKIGRWNRKPSHKKYVAEKRWNKNKAKRIVRMMKKHSNYKIPINVSEEVKSWVNSLLRK